MQAAKYPDKTTEYLAKALHPTTVLSGGTVSKEVIFKEVSTLGGDASGRPFVLEKTNVINYSHVRQRCCLCRLGGEIQALESKCTKQIPFVGGAALADCS